MSEPTVLLSRLHYPVDSLGFGTRAGIWFQGCTVHCRGCVSRDTWPADEAARVPIRDVMDWIRSLPPGLDGITISGGEPTDQPEALAGLLAELLAWRRGARRDVDVLLYTGLSRASAESAVSGLDGLVDALVSGPYDRQLPTAAGLMGSSNQEVHAYSGMGEHRYSDSADRYSGQRTRMGVHVDSDAIWMVGIPRDGDMAALRGRLKQQGIEITRASWLS